MLLDERAGRDRPNVNVTLEDVRVATAVGVLADTAWLTVRIEQRRLVIRD